LERNFWLHFELLRSQITNEEKMVQGEEVNEYESFQKPECMKRLRKSTGPTDWRGTVSTRSTARA
jgi:hypothetical protein